ncbi:hypothetical protein V2G26_000716 [Clonostachys chloroleuca]
MEAPCCTSVHEPAHVTVARWMTGCLLQHPVPPLPILAAKPDHGKTTVTVPKAKKKKNATTTPIIRPGHAAPALVRPNAQVALGLGFDLSVPLKPSMRLVQSSNSLAAPTGPSCLTASTRPDNPFESRPLPQTQCKLASLPLGSDTAVPISYSCRPDPVQCPVCVQHRPAPAALVTPLQFFIVGGFTGRPAVSNDHWVTARGE